MEGSSAPKPHRLLNEARSLFNNPKMSDVRFLVDGQTVYGHKVILGLGSPAFESMFFGELKEKRDVIEIKDLTLIGFQNALRYIYGFEIDFELSELYESYLAADKYLLHNFGKEFFEYVKRKLNAKSSCLIYDQLIKIGDREEMPLASVRTLIIENSQEAFDSEHFTQIDQETLISLLSLDELSVLEIDLLTAVSKWIDCEVQRQGLPMDSANRRRVFEPVRGYILFTALKPDKVASCKEIVRLFTTEEIGLLLLHHLDKANPLMVELKTARRAGAFNPCSVFVSDSHPASGHSYSKTVFLAVNRRISLRAIHSTYSASAPKLRLEFVDPFWKPFNVNTEVLMKDGKWSFSINPPLDVEPNFFYQLEITGVGKAGDEDRLSKEKNLKYKESIRFIFAPGDDADHHCVRGLEFVPLD